MLESSEERLDELDFIIMDTLQNDGRTTNAELARKVHLSPPTVHARLKRLEKNGYIQNYVAVLDRDKVGFDLLCFIQVSLVLHQFDRVQDFRQVIEAMPEVLECHHLTGEYDYLLKVVLRNRADLERFVVNQLTPLPGVSRILTSIVLTQVKSTTNYPCKPAHNPSLVLMGGRQIEGDYQWIAPTVVTEEKNSILEISDDSQLETNIFVARGQQITSSLQQRRNTIRQKKFDTIAVHGVYDAQEALQNQGSIIEPLFASSAQHFESSDHMEAALAYQMPSWSYSRIANPTIGYLEETIALLESYGFAGEANACVTASGMAAVFMATNPFLVQATRNPEPINIVASSKCYGGTFMLFSQRYAIERGIEVRWVRDPLNLAEWASQINENTRFVYGEIPSNPGLAIFDIPAVAELAHAFQTPLIVDSTVSTAALLRPLQHGADIVIHSVSKTMSSSGFAIAGAIVAKHNITCKVGPSEIKENFASYVKLLPFRDHGPALSPFNALMILNDLRTLRSKVDLMSQNAMRVAEYLNTHKLIEDVAYPGLVDFPGHDLAKKYMWLVDGEDSYAGPVNRFGHLLSFTVKGGHQAARIVFDKLQMVWRATDLGRIKSVATIPTISTHQQQGDAGRDLAAVPANLIRLSVGAEGYSDIIADLAQALN